MSTCEKCGNGVSSDLIFCERCGHNLAGEKSCTRCGKKMNSDIQFCGNCGQVSTQMQPGTLTSPTEKVASSVQSEATDSVGGHSRAPKARERGLRIALLVASILGIVLFLFVPWFSVGSLNLYGWNFVRLTDWSIHFPLFGTDMLFVAVLTALCALLVFVTNKRLFVIVVCLSSAFSAVNFGWLFVNQPSAFVRISYGFLSITIFSAIIFILASVLLVRSRRVTAPSISFGETTLIAGQSPI